MMINRIRLRPIFSFFNGLFDKLENRENNIAWGNIENGMNLKQKDLVGIIGGKSRVSEILNRKKRLTVEMIRELERVLNISASVLVNNYQLASWKNNKG